jgi:hypothetical protein
MFTQFQLGANSIASSQAEEKSLEAKITRLIKDRGFVYTDGMLQPHVNLKAVADAWTAIGKTEKDKVNQDEFIACIKKFWEESGLFYYTSYANRITDDYLKRLFWLYTRHLDEKERFMGVVEFYHAATLFSLKILMHEGPELDLADRIDLIERAIKTLPQTLTNPLCLSMKEAEDELYKQKMALVWGSPHEKEKTTLPYVLYLSEGESGKGLAGKGYTFNLNLIVCCSGSGLKALHVPLLSVMTSMENHPEIDLRYLSSMVAQLRNRPSILPANMDCRYPAKLDCGQDAKAVIKTAQDNESKVAESLKIFWIDRDSISIILSYYSQASYFALLLNLMYPQNDKQETVGEAKTDAVVNHPSNWSGKRKGKNSRKQAEIPTIQLNVSFAGLFSGSNAPANGVVTQNPVPDSQFSLLDTGKKFNFPFLSSMGAATQLSGDGQQPAPTKTFTLDFSFK